jgi:hypothetical protein
VLVSSKKRSTPSPPEAVALMTDARRVTGVITEDRVERAIAVAEKAAGAVQRPAA